MLRVIAIYDLSMKFKYFVCTFIWHATCCNVSRIYYRYGNIAAELSTTLRATLSFMRFLATSAKEWQRQEGWSHLQATHSLELRAECACVLAHKNLLAAYCWRCCNNKSKQASARAIGLQNRIDGDGSGSNVEIVYLKYFNQSVI